MAFINSIICGGPGSVIEFRMHIRYEFINLGLLELINVKISKSLDTRGVFLIRGKQKISTIDHELLQTQIDVWLAGFESDEKTIFARLNSSGDLDLDAPDEVVKALGLTAKFTSCFGPFSSVLKHLVLLPQNPFLRCVPVL